MKNWFKEPLLHFLIIGAMIFVVFSVVNKDEIDVSGNKISDFYKKIARARKAFLQKRAVFTHTGLPSLNP